MESIIQWLDKIDRQLFLFLNSFHSPFFDQVWYIITNKYTWFPLYLIFVIFMILYYKKAAIWWILGLGLAILFADQFTSGFMKPFFGRPRPCHNPEFSHLVHIVKSCGGKFGFASGHSANSFAIAMYVWLVFKNQTRQKIWPWVFLWAAIVAFSRVYLGVHYPGDILVGALVGVTSGYLAYGIIRYLLTYYRKKTTAS
ncbi:MAG: phosphatase PAP2 family protein [Cyclobacteriaceae bacterium]